MANDITELLEAGDYSAQLKRLINDPMTSFGPTLAPLLGATFLPEINVPENKYKEEGIKFRTPVANHGTRYSPAQLKSGMMSGEFDVELAYSDIAAQMTAKDYDTFIKFLRGIYGRPGIQGGGVSGPANMDAMTQLLNWAELAIVRPLAARNEIDRWAALINGQVVLTGNNGYNGLVTYPNVSGTRVTAGGTYSNNSYDPIPDITARINYLTRKGYQPIGMVMSTDVEMIMVNNQQVRQRSGIFAIQGGSVTGLPAYLTQSQLANVFSQNKLPPYVVYDATYTTQTDFGWFFPRDTIFIYCATGRNQEISRGDLEPVVVHDTLGYVGVGTVQGQLEPGKHTYMEHIEKKPSSVYIEGYQSSLPVITDPEAFAVITGIA